MRTERHGGFARFAMGPKQTQNTPTQFLDAQDQWTIAHRCLTDDSLPHRRRFVGVLVLMYGQQASTIARLRRSDVTHASGVTLLKLGRNAVVLDEPLATIATDLAEAAVPDARPKGLARSFNAEGDGWLFPGRGPGKAIGEAALRADLRKLDIRTRSGRNTALLTLARDVPPMVLCDLLGVGSSTAERWRSYAGGAWATYASPRDP